MIDTTTGERVAGQEWSAPYSFATECCGAGETAHTDVLGGAVAAVHGTDVHIWFPAELTPRDPHRRLAPLTHATSPHVWAAARPCCADRRAREHVGVSASPSCSGCGAWSSIGSTSARR